MRRISDTMITVGSAFFFFISLIELFFNNVCNSTYHISLVGLVIIVHILCIITWVNKTGRSISLFVFFVLYSLFSCVGQSISYIIGVNSYSNSIYNLFDLEFICSMLRFQFACVAALNVGVIIYLKACKKVVHQQEMIEWYDKKVDNKTGSKTPIALFYLCAAVVIGYAIWQILQRQTMTYSELYQTREGISPLFHYLFCIIGIYQVYNKQNVYKVYCLWLAASFLFFIAGTRSMAFVYIGMLISSFPVTNPKWFQKKYLLGWIVVGVLFFASISVLTATRNTLLNGNSFDFNLINNIDSTSSEMGAAAKPILYTMRYIDDGGERYQTVLYTLMHGIIPTQIMSMLGLTKWNIHLAAWVTNYAGVTWTGLGYSYIAEAYMNFGIMGWGFTFIYGLFIAFAENSAFRRIINGKYLYGSIMLLILSKQVFYARGNLELIDTYYRYSVYIFLAWLVFKGRRRNVKK